MRGKEFEKLLLTVLLLFIMVHMVVSVGRSRAAYPEKPVKIIVGFEPGGSTDISTRVVAAGLEKYLGKPVLIENKGGGGGTVALAVVANAEPDGYTLCSVPSDSFVYTPLMQTVPFKPLKSFTTITAYAYAGHSGLLVKSDAPWGTLKEFLDYAKKNPGKIKYSSAGIGTGMHIAMEHIAHVEGIKWIHVPYKGNAPAVTALLGGHVDACSAAVDSVPVYTQSGAARVLVTHGYPRSPVFPDVPTLKELGYGYVKDTVHSVVGPAGLAQDVVKTLEAAFSKAMETPEFKAMLKQLYLTPIHYNSKEYDQYLKEIWVKGEKMFKDYGVIQKPATQAY